MAEKSPASALDTLNNYLGGAVGAGLVLIVLPCAALLLWVDRLAARPAMGLPIMAIFGIMILFGALSIIATLFARLGLSDSSQALALPEGSIRAAIALALIVLFSIIAIMLYQSTAKPLVIPGLTEAQRTDMMKDPANRVIAVVPEPCAVAAAVPAPSAPATTGAADTPPATSAAPAAACAPGEQRYSVYVRVAPEQESTDLAKQLLILIGTLMTSVTSFYFASRATEPKRKDEPPPATEGDADPPAANPPAVVPAAVVSGERAASTSSTPPS